MQPANVNDLEQMAFLAELARPVAHETNNFLNNLLLQLAISEKTIPEPYRSDWRNIRREGKKLADLLQQWQRHRKLAGAAPGKIDLNQIMEEAVAAQRAEARAIQLVLTTAREPSWIRAFLTDVRCLCFLLTRYALEGSEGSAAGGVEIRMERTQQRILLRMFDTESSSPELLRWFDFEDVAPTERHTLSLPALCCRSLVERLGGSIRIEKDGKARMVLLVDLPLAV